MKKNAFTMLELVLVIVTLAILAAVTIPRLDRDLKQEAADNLLSAIRYTQHLALIDNKHKFDDPNWQKALWQIQIENCTDGLFYTIGSDADYQGDISITEAAPDPYNGRPMFWRNTASCKNGGDTTVSDNIFITKKYGVTGISTSGGCVGVQHIAFDHLGRPHTGISGNGQPTYSSYMSTACIFTFSLSDGDSIQIQIEPESGYAFIVGQPHS